TAQHALQACPGAYALAAAATWCGNDVPLVGITMTKDVCHPVLRHQVGGKAGQSTEQQQDIDDTHHAGGAALPFSPWALPPGRSTSRRVLSTPSPLSSGSWQMASSTVLRYSSVRRPTYSVPLGPCEI